MNKQEFISELAKSDDIPSKAAASKILDQVKSILKDQLTSGNEVALGSDFGTFKPTSRSGNVPGTTTPYTSSSVKFSISAPFKRELNK